MARVDRVLARDRDDRHRGVGGLGRPDSRRGILKHQTVLDPLSQALGRQQEAVGCRLRDRHQGAGHLPGSHARRGAMVQLPPDGRVVLGT